MGIIRATLQPRNPSMGNALSPIEVDALVATGAVHLCLPEHLAIQLDLVELERREVSLANGHSMTVPYVGPVEWDGHVERGGTHKVHSSPAVPSRPTLPGSPGLSRTLTHNSI